MATLKRSSLREDHRGEMTSIMGLVLMGMIVFVVGSSLTTTVATTASDAADNMDNLLPGNGGSSLIRLSGGTLWGLVLLGVIAVLLLKMFGYV